MGNQKKNVRDAALDVIEAVEKNQSYSNLLLNHAIERNKLEGPDVGLLTEIVYGTIQRKLTLDYYLNPFLKNRKKLEGWVLNLLRLSLYQIVYLDKIPERAAIYEAVEIAKKRGHKGISSMVNGVLRNLQRKGIPSMDEIKDPIERISIETSNPYWLTERWVEMFGLDKTMEMCKANLIAPNQTVRVNTTKISRDELVRILNEEGFVVEKSPLLPEAIQSLRGNVAHSDAYKQGLCTIQDESSMMVAYALQLEDQLNVLDACAAPGGKSTHIAEKLHGTGNVVSLDLHEHKVKLIVQNAKRLGLENIAGHTLDSRKVQEKFKEGTFDRILVDAPCSGLGVLRRKPDIKYSKKASDIQALQKIQHAILDAVAPLLKKDGILVYSTCTVDQWENEKAVQDFLDSHSDFEPIALSNLPEPVHPFANGHQMQIFPQDFGGDGFYIASVSKK
ncbi:16S rRNA (cytosine(967)-C(5))-methyltransferase RsmB [Falsibacillus albus]|uniref:16S rRNA (cytosine(967)-C(5))-methyltransferase n=1 Tax=Falsibacillus albus TaxID=2478915 RepID=A0A3L7JZ26_9BACI|nr:16S rRNA (cytosine(967)-C(5))-methyltransferase RsmB [Falsibacillus albus]RLQ95790.1 16S rRNA (cytosine(967)-C(5))-methyltransferase RsmB [Falsibacillus albus]